MLPATIYDTESLHLALITYREKPSPQGGIVLLEQLMKHPEPLSPQTFSLLSPDGRLAAITGWIGYHAGLAK